MDTRARQHIIRGSKNRYVIIYTGFDDQLVEAVDEVMGKADKAAYANVIAAKAVRAATAAGFPPAKKFTGEEIKAAKIAMAARIATAETAEAARKTARKIARAAKVAPPKAVKATATAKIAEATAAVKTAETAETKAAEAAKAIKAAEIIAVAETAKAAKIAADRAAALEAEEVKGVAKASIILNGSGTVYFKGKVPYIFTINGIEKTIYPNKTQSPIIFSVDDSTLLPHDNKIETMVPVQETKSPIVLDNSALLPSRHFLKENWTWLLAMTLLTVISMVCTGGIANLIGSMLIGIFTTSSVANGITLVLGSFIMGMMSTGFIALCNKACSCLLTCCTEKKIEKDLSQWAPLINRTDDTTEKKIEENPKKYIIRFINNTGSTASLYKKLLREGIESLTRNISAPLLLPLPEKKQVRRCNSVPAIMWKGPVQACSVDGLEKKYATDGTCLKRVGTQQKLF